MYFLDTENLNKVEHASERELKNGKQQHKTSVQNQTAYVNFSTRGASGPDYVAPSAYSIKRKRIRARIPTIRNFAREAPYTMKFASARPPF